MSNQESRLRKPLVSQERQELEEEQLEEVTGGGLLGKCLSCFGKSPTKEVPGIRYVPSQSGDTVPVEDYSTWLPRLIGKK